MTSDLTLNIKTVAIVANATDVSAGITVPSTTTAITLGQYRTGGQLRFDCAAEVTGTQLEYSLTGGDATKYQLSSLTVTVTANEATA